MLHARGEAGQHRLDDRLQVEAGLGVELGGEADLGVNDPVLGQVLHALAGYPLEGLSGLHHGDGVGEAFEVADEVPARRLGHKPAGRAPPGRWSGGPRSRRPRPARRPSRAGGRRRDGRGGAPWARAGFVPGSGAVSCKAGRLPTDAVKATSRGSTQQRSLAVVLGRLRSRSRRSYYHKSGLSRGSSKFVRGKGPVAGSARVALP